jgi:hypothetical protein
MDGTKLLKENQGHIVQNFLQTFSKNKKLYFACFSQILLNFSYSHPWIVIFFKKKIKDDYGEDFAEILGKVQSRFSYFDGSQYVPTFPLVL